MLFNLSESNWSTQDYNLFLTELESLGDAKFRKRAETIVRTGYQVLGISMSELKSIGKEISKGNPDAFLKIAGTENYESVIIQAYVLSNMKLNLDEFTKLCDEYLSKSNSWATCDMVIHFKQVTKFRDEYYQTIKNYLHSSNPWLQRSGLVFLLKFYNLPEYNDNNLKLSTEINSDDYYVQMAQAWLYAVIFPNNQEKIYQIIKSDPTSKMAKLTVRKIKSLRHTTNEEKEQLTALIN
ncbi:DNA alkylation repair protein [Companilactobacillus mishanensis]|uniref:DNA alkylation repair protein n=1 Tax=Companilactobacillus mishanensis TaxID=2486008 RepID=A0ABW9P8B1_9LACO|nr:DNA alkylation repair protein [Companilactobacillus mishanensis]MQS45449.1 DNA alkylation repair protein [Companilactobacillus mishanensis]